MVAYPQSQGCGQADCVPPIAPPPCAVEDYRPGLSSPVLDFGQRHVLLGPKALQLTLNNSGTYGMLQVLSIQFIRMCLCPCARCPSHTTGHTARPAGAHTGIFWCQQTPPLPKDSGGLRTQFPSSPSQASQPGLNRDPRSQTGGAAGCRRVNKLPTPCPIQGEIEIWHSFYSQDHRTKMLIGIDGQTSRNLFADFQQFRHETEQLIFSVSMYFFFRGKVWQKV